MNFKILLLVSFIIFSLNKLTAQGNDPCSAVTLTIGVGGVCSNTAGTTVGATYSNNAANGGTPACAVPGRADVWYRIVLPNVAANMVITTTAGTLTDMGLSLYTTSNGLCSGTLTQVACDDDSGPGFMPGIVYCNPSLNAGSVIFIRLWSRGGVFGDPLSTGTFSICVYNLNVQNSSSTNCSGGTQVCNSNNFTGNNSGSGISELTGCNAGCLGGENNSSWYWINVGTTGNLEMTITPSNGTDDYDFAIWGPINSCPPVSAPVRCNYAAFPRAAGCGTNTNPTGMTAAGTNTTAAACDNRPYLSPLAVTAGQTYILLIDGFTPSSQQFSLSWGGTASLSCTPIVLPIELTNFSGRPYEKSNIIEWSTATEINNDYFTVEKSQNGIDFSILSTVKGGGMSNETKHYSTIDSNPTNGITYYRLKQTDYNGKFSYSEIISIENKFGGFSVNNVHPNPTTTDINFDFYSPISGIVNVQILDYTGRVVVEENMTVGEGKTSLNAKMAELAKGIYSLKVSFEQTGYSSVNMVIKQ